MCHVSQMVRHTNHVSTIRKSSGTFSTQNLAEAHACHVKQDQNRLSILPKAEFQRKGAPLTYTNRNFNLSCDGKRTFECHVRLNGRGTILLGKHSQQRHTVKLYARKFDQRQERQVRFSSVTIKSKQRFTTTILCVEPHASLQYSTTRST